MLEDQASPKRCDHKMVNLIEHGKTPVLEHDELAVMGYKNRRLSANLVERFDPRDAAILGGITARRSAAAGAEGLTAAVGFPEYYAAEQRYKNSSTS